MPIPAYYLVLAFAVLLSLIKFRKQSPRYFQLFLPFLLMNLAVETYGIITKAKDENNVLVYNLSTTIEFAFYFFIFYKTLSNIRVRKALVVISWLFFPFCIVNIFLIQGIKHFHSFSFMIGSLLVICLAVLYFQDQINLEDDPLKNPLRRKMFWISTGVLFFYTVGFFNLGLFELIHLEQGLLKNVTDLLLNILNMFLYCTFIIALVIKNEE